MNFEIYCDESRPDSFWSKSMTADQYLLIGGLWIQAELRETVKARINDIKQAHGIGGEIKWHKVSRNKEAFYMALVDFFIEMHLNLRFRCIVVDKHQVNFVRFHDSDRELGFYKFYYQLIKHWILDFNEYVIFCDIKTNRRKDRLKVLRRCLDYSNLSSTVHSVQAIPSHESAIIQLTDFLLGAAGARLNNSVAEDSSKDRIIKHLERGLKVGPIHPTPKTEQKFNVFKISLQGGW